MKTRAPLPTALALTLAVGMGVPAVAASQGFRWWQAERFQRELALTADQVTRLEEIFRANEGQLRRQKRELDRLEAALSRLVADGQADEQEAAALIDKVEAARAALSKTRTFMLFKMRRVLTTDQHLKLQVLHEQWERERRQRSGRSRESEHAGDR